MTGVEYAYHFGPSPLGHHLNVCVSRSATNYLLGLTPLQLPAYMLGTFVGLAFWCSIYASLGGASRSLLQSGVSFDVLLTGLFGSPAVTPAGIAHADTTMIAEVLAKAGAYTEDVAQVALALGVLVLIGWYSGLLKGSQEGTDIHTPDCEEEDLEHIK